MATGNGVLLSLPWDQAFGGVTLVVRNLARYLEECGHRPILLLPGDHERPHPGRAQIGIPAYFQTLRPPVVPGRAPRSLAAFLAYLPSTVAHLAALVRRERISVLNVHYPGENGHYYALVRRALPVRLVTSIHGSDVVPESGRMTRPPAGLRALLDASDVIVSPSAAFRDAFLADFPRYAAKTVVVWNGVVMEELDAHLASDDPASDAECAAITGGAPYVLSVADQTPKKALDVLVRAFPAVAAAHPSLVLVLVGDPRLQAELEALADALGVRDRVRITGRRPPRVVARLLRDARLFALPSRQEPFGIAAVEALALGAPTVVTAVEGLREVLRDGVTGLHVPPDDAAALATAMLRLLGDDRLRARLSAAGRADVRDRFDWRSTGAAYVRDVFGLADPH
jgi:glycosyltransferase involved in cell wall biosynthesis